MEVLTYLLICILSVAISKLLFFLVRIVLVAIFQVQVRAHFIWPPGSRFLGDHRARCDISLSTTRYKRPSDRPNETVECVFCLSHIEEGEELRVLRCRHLFHRSCLDRWLLHRQATCPLCRDALVPHEPTSMKSGSDAHMDDDDDDEELHYSAAMVFAYVSWWMW